MHLIQIALMFICVFVETKQATLTIRKYNLNTVPSAGWYPQSTKTDISSLIDCEEEAKQAGQYSFNYDEASKICRMGHVDLSITGAGDIEILTLELSHVGLVHGGAGFTDFEVVLPNGKVCSPADNGLPSVGTARRSHGLAEMDGIIYLCGGELDTGGATDECFTLDLNAPTPTWESMASFLSPRLCALEDGLIAHKDADGAVVLFAFFEEMCAGDNAVNKYQNGVWSTAGKVSPTWRAPVVQHGSLVYIVSGDLCGDSSQRENIIQVYDMNQPDKDAQLLTHSLASGFRNGACVVMPVGSVEGLLCSGGNPDGARSKLLQFVPLTEDGRDSAGPCLSLPELPEIRTHALTFYFWGTGEALLYGGYDTEGSNTIFVWNPLLQTFEDLGHVMTSTRNEPATAMVDSKWFKEKCWKYLD